MMCNQALIMLSCQSADNIFIPHCSNHCFVKVVAMVNDAIIALLLLEVTYYMLVLQAVSAIRSSRAQSMWNFILEVPGAWPCNSMLMCNCKQKPKRPSLKCQYFIESKLYIHNHIKSTGYVGIWKGMPTILIPGPYVSYKMYLFSLCD